MPILGNPEGQKALAVELFERFHAMKTYGREPESLESTIRIFTKDLEKYPANLILKAISTHAKRSNEFPTTADIIGLIRRNGRPPLSKERYISIQRKEREFWTREERRYVDEYDEELSDSWDDEIASDKKIQQLHADNELLRARLAEAKAENILAWQEVKQLRAIKQNKHELNEIEKINRTIKAMEDTGAPKENIEEFKKMMSVAA